MFDETRAALRQAAIDNNVRVLTEVDEAAGFPPDISKLVDVRDVLERYDRGESIR